MKKIGLVVKIDPEAELQADKLQHWCENKGVSVFRRPTAYTTPSSVLQNKKELAPADLDCVLVMGGDGTFLSAVRWIGDQAIPILGVKFGEVGFLAAIAEDSLYDVVQSIVVEEMFTTSSRMRLCVKVMRKGRLYAREMVLNDIVINKNALARLASIHTSINDHHLTTFKADGLIVATPTGSTAYSLAAGGPVIHPAVPGILLSPICPFTLTNRPLIISDTDRISIRLDSSASDIMVTFDGQIGMEITAEDEISVHKSLHPVRMIDIPGQNYFDVLKAKLRWSGGRV